MTLSLMGWIYLFAFLIGLGFTFVSLFLSHGHSGDLHADAPGHVHADLHLQAHLSLHHTIIRSIAHSVPAPGPSDSGQPDFPLFSPLTLALSITIFGGVGTILNALRLPTLATLPASILAGVLGWAIAFYAFFKFFRFAQSSSEAIVEQLIGKDAALSVSIPAGGMGEVVYVARGSRYTAPARSESGAAMAAGTTVTIVSIHESICTVKESVEERLKRLSDSKEEPS